MKQAQDLVSVLREANQAINPKLIQMAEDRGGKSNWWDTRAVVYSAASFVTSHPLWVCLASVCSSLPASVWPCFHFDFLSQVVQGEGEVEGIEMTVAIATLAAGGISTATAKTAAMTLTDKRKPLTVSPKTGLAVTTAVEILTGVTAAMDSQTLEVVSPAATETKVIRTSSLVPTKGAFRMAWAIPHSSPPLTLNRCHSLCPFPCPLLHSHSKRSYICFS